MLSLASLGVGMVIAVGREWAAVTWYAGVTKGVVLHDQGVYCGTYFVINHTHLT